MAFPNIFAEQYFGNNVYQYLLFFGLVVASILVGRVVYFIAQTTIRKLTGKTKTKLDDVLIDILEEPLVFLIVVFGFYMGYHQLTLSEHVAGIFLATTKMLSTVAFAWFFIKFIDAMIVMYIMPATEKTESELDDVLVPILRKVVKVTLVSMTVIMILANFGYDVTSIIAGLGIGGLAFAFAAKDLLANLFGGMVIIIDKPFKIGHWVTIGGNEGEVVEIGLRSTKLKTGNGELITVPNKFIAEMAIVNYTKYKQRAVILVLGLACDTSNEKIEKAKGHIKEILSKNSEVSSGSVEVNFIGFGQSTYDLEVRYKINTNSAAAVRKVKDAVNSQIKLLLEKEKIELAYPTQTLYIKK